MNLTPHRGPSVWSNTEHHGAAVHMTAAAVGIAITALAWRATPPRRFWIAGLGAASAIGALMAGRLGDRAAAVVSGMQSRSRARRTDALDRTLQETFPASDAPAVW